MYTPGILFLKKKDYTTLKQKFQTKCKKQIFLEILVLSPWVYRQVLVIEFKWTLGRGGKGGKEVDTGMWVHWGWTWLNIHCIHVHNC